MVKNRLRITRSRRVLAAWVAVAIGMLLVGSMLVPWGRPRPAVSASAATPAAAVSAAAASVAAPAVARPSRTPPSRVVALCGGGSLSLRADGEVDPVEYQEAVHPVDVERRVVAALHADGADLAEATARFLEYEGFGKAPSDASNGDDDTATQAAVQSLVSLASTSTDPRVYVLALRACNHVEHATACAMLSADRWAALDPDNAAAWLPVAAEAEQARDAAALASVMRRIASATRVQTYANLVSAEVAAHLPENDGALLGGIDAMSRASSLDHAAAATAFQTSQPYCKEDQLADPERRSACEAMGRLMADTSDTLIGRVLGERIGERLTGAGDRIELIDAEIDAYSTAEEARTFDMLPRLNGRGYGCANARRAFGWLRERQHDTEPSRVREAVGASGKTPDELVQAYRAKRAAFASAASAASALASVPSPSASAALR